MAATLTVTINDPQTISLLLQYKQFLQEEGVDGTLQEAAAGLMVGSLDENHRFNRWAKANRQAGGSASAAQGNVTPLPTGKTASARATATPRRATA